MMDAVVLHCGCWQAVLHGMSQLCTKSSNMMWLQTKLSPHFCSKFILLSIVLCISSNFPLDGHVLLFQQVLYYLMLVHHVMLSRSEITGIFNTVSGSSAH